MKRFHISETILSAGARALGAICVTVVLAGCSGYNATYEPVLVSAAKEQISESKAAGSTDTQCSDYVASVLRKMGVGVPAFQANDFDGVMTKFLPAWKLTEFSTDNLKQSRADLRNYLNAFPDHTAFLAQWPRSGESGHVAIIYKISLDQFEIFQAQAGKSTPNSKSTKVEALLYGQSGVERSRLRLWTEPN